MSGSSIDHNEGRKAMDKCFLHIKKGLLDVLDADSKVREDAFSEVFKKEDFIDFVFSNLLSLLMKNATSCDFLLIVVRRMIYPMTTN